MSIEFNNLKLFRNQNGFTQEEVAERLNVSRQAVAKWERGESVPDIENCIALADMYGTTVDMLVRNINSTLGTSEGTKHIFGLSKMNDKGQITLPKKCREVFDLNSGDAILVLGDEDKGIALVKLGSSLGPVGKKGGKNHDSNSGKGSDKKIQGKNGGGRSRPER